MGGTGGGTVVRTGSVCGGAVTSVAGGGGLTVRGKVVSQVGGGLVGAGADGAAPTTHVLTVAGADSEVAATGRWVAAAPGAAGGVVVGPDVAAGCRANDTDAARTVRG